MSDTSEATWTVLGRPLPRRLQLALSLDLVLAGICFCVLAVITFAGAVSRYFLDAPFIWLEELQMALFLGMVFLGMGAAARAGGHVAIDVVTDLFPERLRRAVIIGATAVVVLVVGFYTWEALQQVQGMAQLGRQTSILRIPTALIYAVTPIGFALMILNSVLALLFRTADDDAEHDGPDDLEENLHV
jgi:TRAP-type C4-dicarboxylate transport system permease small subunit